MVIVIRDAERDMAERDGREWLGLGPRQYAYRLKSRGFMFADTSQLDKSHFDRVEDKIVRMRRCGMLSWDDVADARGIEKVPLEFQDNRERIATLAVWVEEMSHVRLEGQLVVPELWVETEGLYNLIYDIADRYGARSRSLQGQSSVTARRKLTERVADRWNLERVRTRVLGVVDYDKYGGEILEAIAADTAQHLRDMEYAVDEEQILQIKRVALTEWQIRKHKIPLVQKDSRPVQEAEALPTDVLRAEVDAALKDTLDMDLFDDVAREKQPEIDGLARKIQRMRAP